MALHQLKSNPGSRKRRTRVGRGLGSGLGKTSSAGQKGQNSRSGGGVAPGFEGGQNPIYRRIPKRGFTNYTRVTFNVVNISDLERFVANTEVTPTLLVEAGLIKNNQLGVKVLGDGSLTKPLKVVAAKFSKAAEAAITKAGGTFEVLP
jgi:large subunit ribosomal protein L15